MGKKMKMTTVPDSAKVAAGKGMDHTEHSKHVAIGAHVLKSVGEALANSAPPVPQAGADMGPAFMPDMGQNITPPPKIAPPILPPGVGPTKKPSKRFTASKALPKPAWKTGNRVTAGNKIDSVKGKSPSVDKEQRKQINDIIKK